MTIKVTGNDLTTFNALTNLEQQVTFLVGMLLVAQNAYNDAHSTTPKNVVAVTPSYATRTVALQCQFSIEGDSVLQALHANVTEAIPA